MQTLHVGFTGTQTGMTKFQRERVGWLFDDLRIKNSDVVFHHGDCKGADADAHVLARAHGFRVIGHPPSNPSKRAWCLCDDLWPEKEYLVRNHEIVDAVALMIACPKEMDEVLRSGTWATVRYARSKQKLWTIVRPTAVQTVNKLCQ